MAGSDIAKDSPLNVLAAMASGEPRDLWTLQGKLTFVGPRKKPVPSLIFTTFHHLARMDWFPPPGIEGADHAGDDSVAWQLTTTPEEMQSIVASLAGLGEVFRQSEPPRSPHVSLMMALKESRLGDLAFEIILDLQDAKITFDAIRGSLDRANGLAVSVMELHRQALFGAG